MSDSFEITYFLNVSSGEIHKLIDGRSKENCNVDQIREAGSGETITEDEARRIVESRPEDACAHCYHD